MSPRWRAGLHSVAATRLYSDACGNFEFITVNTKEHNYDNLSFAFIGS